MASFVLCVCPAAAAPAASTRQLIVDSWSFLRGPAVLCLVKGVVRLPKSWAAAAELLLRSNANLGQYYRPRLRVLFEKIRLIRYVGYYVHFCSPFSWLSLGCKALLFPPVLHFRPVSCSFFRCVVESFDHAVVDSPPSPALLGPVFLCLVQDLGQPALATCPA